MSSYLYRSLEDDEIRLLELHSGNNEDPLEASLHVCRLPEDEEPRDSHQVLITRDGGFNVPNAPSYQALSYVWGAEDAPLQCLNIIEDESSWQLFIKPNLDDALRRFRRAIPAHSSQLLWIDAICINQDDIPEKNTQIRKMAMIYNRAESVAVWLGIEDQDSTQAMNFIKELLHLNDFDPLIRDPGSSSQWTALLNLMQRSWFNRRWIVQEIALARRATVFCGQESVSWQDFSSAVALFVSRHQDLKRLFTSNTGSGGYLRLFGEVEALGAKALVDVTSNLFRKSDDGIVLERLYSLEALVSSLTAFEVTVPHDTIYAVLWLAHDAEPDSKEPAAMSQDAVIRTPVDSPDVDHAPSPSPDPEEELSVLHIGDGLMEAPHVITSGIPFPGHQHRTLHPESNASIQPQNIIPKTPFPGSRRRSPSPSRNPSNQLPKGQTWLRPPEGQVLRAICGRSATDGSLRKAEQHFKDDPEQIFVDYKKEVYEVCRQFLEFAIARSKSLDIICHPWAPDPPGTESQLPSWINRASRAPFKKMPKYNTYVRVFADPLVGTPGNGPRNYNASGKTKPYPNRGFIIGRTLVVTGFVLDAIKVRKSAATGGSVPSDWLDLVNWAGPSHPLPDRFWRTLVADRGPEAHRQPPAYFPLACKWVFEKAAVSPLIDTAQMLERTKLPSIVIEFLRRVQSVIWGRRLALTDARKGAPQLLCLVPPEAEEGDLICIIYGCSVPVVLRRRRKRKNADSSTPILSRESTLEDSRSSSLNSIHDLPMPQINTPQLLSNNATPLEVQPAQAGLSVLSVPTETPSSAYSSHGVRKLLGEEEKERQNPPSLAISLDSRHQYNFIGECYVHGMMAGEGFKHQHEHSNPLKVFHVV
ncbi:heterokaryon incompatibility protein-domain-containing protein [Tricladium varicosporioides]|nr:heterokaryon incompatibility protein-domain-containing protein [Hymenoscyphus varicosporioides]